MTLGRALWLLLLGGACGGILACGEPKLPEDGRLACDRNEDCPRGWHCRADGRCHRTPEDGGQDVGSDVLADAHDAFVVVDGGMDGGGPDAPGTDAIVVADAGFDGGPSDGAHDAISMDSPIDAGPDARTDAGTDAGPCSQRDEPDLGANDENGDGADGLIGCPGFIYVSPGGNPDSNGASPMNPTNLRRAIEMATRSRDRMRILLATGGYTLDMPISLNNPHLVMVGGYQDNFRSRSGVSVINGPPVLFQVSGGRIELRGVE
ncbi:MAG: hypothetical protein NZM37_12880, partial [Sandaracinaceae bacterium]|nr:hypothetical protein [Sandaracinaceae bacterium]